MNRGDVWVIEGGEELRFTLEAGHAVRSLRHLFREDLDRDLALELGVAGAIHLTHPALPERGEDLEDAEAGSGGEGHPFIYPGMPGFYWSDGEGCCVRG